MKKFVILAMQRTGSNMLLSALNSHPQIICHGVLLRGHGNLGPGENGIPNLGRKEIELIKKLKKEFWNEDYRLKHQLEFLEGLVSLSENSEYTGFKLMLEDRYESAITQVIKRNDYKIILLARNNILASYSSNEISNLTGQHIAGRNADIKKLKVEFKPNSFERFYKKRQTNYSKARQLLKDSGQQFLEVEYSQLRSHEGFKSVLRFLNINPDQKLNITTKKRNSDNILERFINQDFVSTYLKDQELQHWATEK